MRKSRYSKHRPPLKQVMKPRGNSSRNCSIPQRCQPCGAVEDFAKKASGPAQQEWDRISELGNEEGSNMQRTTTWQSISCTPSNGRTVLSSMPGPTPGRTPRGNMVVPCIGANCAKLMARRRPRSSFAKGSTKSSWMSRGQVLEEDHCRGGR